MLLTPYKTAVFIFAVLLGLLTAGCKKKDNPDTPDTPAGPGVFDKQGMLVNLADNVIVPNYASFKSALDSLAHTYTTFTALPDAVNLHAVKQSFHKAYLRYQLISPYEFGPAETMVVQMNFNVFPADTSQINANISTGNYDLGAVTNLDAKGFPALDFLFYGAGEEFVLGEFGAKPARKKYAGDLITDMQTRINSVINTWNGSYRNAFVNSLGTDVGSSIGFLVNRINFELDYLKNAKIGIPLGKKSLGVPVPGNCEALYSAYSVEFALETLTAIKHVYEGSSAAGVDGKGFDDYLAHLNSQYVNGPLHAAISQQFVTAHEKLKAIPSPLSQQVTANAGVVDAAHTELLRLLVLLKTDMPSALGVVITYQDGDGD